MRKNPGLEGQRQGREAEETIAEAFNAAGWGTFTSPKHDYAHKTDVVAICPNGEVFNVQVSVNPKSKRQTATLKKKRRSTHITPGNDKKRGEPYGACVR